jgi:Zn-dependent membrane protease YugP
MSLFIILAIIAIVFLFVGGFVQTLQWLLWIGIILLAVAVIMWLLRFISGRRTSL